MDIKKLVPWNWFKKEDEGVGRTIPVRREAMDDSGWTTESPLDRFHQEMDRIFEQTFRGFGLSPFGSDRWLGQRMADQILKPTLDLGATDKEYTITIEVPGVDEKDIKLEMHNDTLTLKGEKKLEDEEKGKNYYRMERSFGAFERILSLPEDADQDNVKASFKKGVLTITLARKAIPRGEVRQIEVKST